MKVKLISLGISAPLFSYSQAEIFQSLGYPRHFWRLFKPENCGIDKRHFIIPVERIRKLSFQQQQEEYLKGAIQLSKQAISDCLDDRDPKEIGALIFTSCTGICPGPTIGHYLIKELGLSSDIEIRNVVNQGCEGGGYPGLRTAIDFTTTKNKPSLVVATELSSLTYFPEPEGKPDPENDWELLRSNAIFADFASAALIGFDDKLHHPVIIDSESFTNPDYLNELGYTWRDGRLRVLLSKRVPQYATEITETVVWKLFKKLELKVSDIDYWIIHAAGVKVIDMIRDRLGIDEAKLRFSRQFLREYGNCSSATVGGVAKLMINQIEVKGGEYIAVITIGPGMTSGCSILSFGQ